MFHKIGGEESYNTLQAKAQFKRRSTANNVQISIPVPDDADTPRFRTNIGTVHYAPETSSIVWKIKQFGGGKEFLMRAELGLPSVRGDDEKGGGMMGGFGGSMGGVGGGKGKRPINVKFEIPYFTTSGIQVRYLKIIEPKVSNAEIGSINLFENPVCDNVTPDWEKAHVQFYHVRRVDEEFCMLVAPGHPVSSAGGIQLVLNSPSSSVPKSLLTSTTLSWPLSSSSSSILPYP